MNIWTEWLHLSTKAKNFLRISFYQRIGCFYPTINNNIHYYMLTMQISIFGDIDITFMYLGLYACIYIFVENVLRVAFWFILAAIGLC